MKNTLLKIVRERFKIVRFDRLIDPNSIYYPKHHNKPFWVLTDNDSEYESEHISYDDAYDKLKILIYFNYFKYKKISPNKVWYNG
jgi:hypothetical protein